MLRHIAIGFGVLLAIAVYISISLAMKDWEYEFFHDRHEQHRRGSR